MFHINKTLSDEQERVTDQCYTQNYLEIDKSVDECNLTIVGK